MRDCENCIYSGNDGCVKWECEFVSKEEARRIVAEKKELTTDGDCISRKSVIQMTREMISAEEYGLMDLLDEVKKLPTITQTNGDLISRKAVLSRLNEIKNEKVSRNGELPKIDRAIKCVEELPTIPQTNLTYDMVEQYAKENGFVIWTKEQTEDTLRKLLNYMDTEKQTDSDLAEFLLAKVKDFESVAIRVKHNTENLDRLIDYIHRVIKNAENGTFTVEKQTDSVLAEIKAEINEIDSMTFVGSGSGCASEMQMECLKIISKHISRKENNSIKTEL